MKSPRYMEYDPGMPDPGMPGTSSNIIMNPLVRSYQGTHKFLMYFLVHSFHHFFSGWDLFSQRIHHRLSKEETATKPDNRESRKHLRLFVIKLLHKLQHVATWLLVIYFLKPPLLRLHKPSHLPFQVELMCLKLSGT